MPTGEKLYTNGYRPNHPILVIPGLCCSVLTVEESTYEPWVGRNLWLDISMVGLDKFTDGLPLFGGRKKKSNKDARRTVKDVRISGPSNFRSHTLGSSNTIERLVRDMETNEEIEMADVDTESKRRWIAHMVLGAVRIADPPGIRVRPVPGLDGCAYLDPKMKAFSYVWGPFFEVLQTIGYNETNLQAATYDWRIPPGALERRDQYFTEMAKTVQRMAKVNKKPVVLIGHSLGTRCGDYFLRWAERHKGREWISQNIHMFIAVGPLFLGAPKSLRATVSGERMGLDAFLYPEEGVMLSRQVGSSPWMYPSYPLDFNLKSFAQVRNEFGGYKSCTLPQLLAKGGCQESLQLHEEQFKSDPFFGEDKTRRTPPPVDRMWSIYGINLPTETMYFYRPCEGGITDLQLDPEGTIPGYKCQNGIAYETRKTPQVGGRCASGDGTVPYASMAYCKKWKKLDTIDMKITELDKCDHRDILKDSRFIEYMVDYLCTQITTLHLPESIPSIATDVYLGSGNRGRRSKIRKLVIGRHGIDLQHSSETVMTIMYPDVTSCESKDYTMIIKSCSTRKPLVIEYDAALTLAIEIKSRVKYLMALRESVSSGFHDARDDVGQTELHRAVALQDENKVTALLATRLDVNVIDIKGYTPLHHAMSGGNANIIQALLNVSSNASINTLGKDGSTPLFLFMRNKTDEKWESTENILERLLSRSASVNQSNVMGLSPLHQAVMKEQPKTVEWLLRHNANVNQLTDRGDTPLHLAVSNANETVAKILVDHGADTMIQNQSQKTALALARTSSQSLFQLLQESDGQGASAEYGPDADEIGQTSLHKAVLQNQVDEAFKLLQSGSDVNFADRRGYTPLLLAAQSGYLDLVLLMLTILSANVSITTNNGSTLLHLLAQVRAPQAEVKRLILSLEQTIARGNPVDVVDSEGMTPLHCAASKNNHDSVKFLISQKADVNKATTKGLTPLYLALQPSTRDAQVIQTLIRSNADVNFDTGGGQTPLVLARQLDDAVPWRTTSYVSLLDPTVDEVVSVPSGVAVNASASVGFMSPKLTSSTSATSSGISRSTAANTFSSRSRISGQISVSSSSMQNILSGSDGEDLATQISNSPPRVPTTVASSAPTSAAALTQSNSRSPRGLSSHRRSAPSLANSNTSNSTSNVARITSTIGSPIDSEAVACTSPPEAALEQAVEAFRSAISPVVACGVSSNGKVKVTMSSDNGATRVQYLDGNSATADDVTDALQKAQREYQQLAAIRRSLMLSAFEV